MGLPRWNSLMTNPELRRRGLHRRIDLWSCGHESSAATQLSALRRELSLRGTVTLADTTPGAAIYYTTNGVTPTVNSTKYSTPIAVSASTTIQAIAVASNYNNSAIAAGTYFFGSLEYRRRRHRLQPAPGSYNSAQSVTLSTRLRARRFTTHQWNHAHHGLFGAHSWLFDHG